MFVVARAFLKCVVRSSLERCSSEDELTVDDAAHTLTVSVAPYFSARWLTLRLGRWWARHPNSDLQLRHAPPASSGVARLPTLRSGRKPSIADLLTFWQAGR
ncbi:hypothetical protein [Piscinibacter sp. XHJ-5]|uniref:hypothetical protein n=1 Tax=Piscinibacter sp. XHJ-5 TaxID=3037797 RepID=UPI002452F47A|nr:hypothetical protein [Piscinibacter sp. XHJ-5]